MASLDVLKNTALPFVLTIEGGYSDNAKDKGGKTYKGITTTEYITYREHCGKPIQAVQCMSDEEMEDIYLKDYWMTAHCPSLSDMLAVVCFDTSVNHGPGRSAILLQNAVGVPVDGIVGPMTLKALAYLPEHEVIAMYLKERMFFYDAIVKHDPTQQVFYSGWIRRLTFLTAYVTGQKDIEQIKKEW